MKLASLANRSAFFLAMAIITTGIPRADEPNSVLPDGMPDQSEASQELSDEQTASGPAKDSSDSNGPTDARLGESSSTEASEGADAVHAIDRSGETFVPADEVALSIAAIVGDATVDPRLPRVAAMRDKAAATRLESLLLSPAPAESSDRAAPSRKDAYRVLRQDFHRPRMHLLALEAAADESSYDSESGGYALEIAHQEAEYLRQSNADAEILARSQAIVERLPPRSFDATREFVQRAADTFRAGAAIYIEYDSDNALTIESGSEDGLKRFRIPVRYVRSPKFPPRGCQVVMMIVDMNADPATAAEAPAICASDYLPCAFEAGKLEGEYLTLDRIEIGPGTRLLAHVATASADERIAGVPLSNSIAIPIMLRKAPSHDAGIAEDDPFLLPSEATKSAESVSLADAEVAEPSVEESSDDAASADAVPVTP